MVADEGVPPLKLQFHEVALGVRSVNVVQKGAHDESAGIVASTGKGFTVRVTVAVADGVPQLSVKVTVYVVVAVGVTLTLEPCKFPGFQVYW